jgi:hypothetical protein
MDRHDADHVPRGNGFFVVEDRRCPMKPGDHPEFFRLPAPEGRSRESSIRLDRQGRFWHEGQLVVHSGMQRAFASWIDRHPDDGRFILQNGYDWTYISVEDVPFFIRAVRARGDEVVISLSDGSEEVLEPATVVSGDGDTLYAQVRGGRFEARFTQEAQAALVPYVVETPGGGFGLEVAGRVHAIGPRAAI